MPVASADYAIGLNASALLKDGGTLQVGIGALGDAVVHAAILRQQHNDAYRQLLHDSGISQRHADLITTTGGLEPFKQGLYGATEMLVDGFMHLYQAGILRRRVYDFWALQQLVNYARFESEQLTPNLLTELDRIGVLSLGSQEFARLQNTGLLHTAFPDENGLLYQPAGRRP